MHDGYAVEVERDHLRAQSLIKSAKDALLTVKEISLKERNFKSIVRELYEALRQYCEAIGYLEGYKFNSHEAVTYFLNDLLKEEKLSFAFDRYRKLRNGINYYGRDVAEETVKKALIEIPEMVRKLESYAIKEKKNDKTKGDKGLFKLSP